MAITISSSSNVRHSSGDQMKINFTAAITTGTETITAASLGLTIIEDIWATNSLGYTYDVTPSADGSTAALVAYQSAAESASAGPLVAVSTATVAVSPTFVAYGR